MGVARDGIILYQAGDRPLATPRPRTPTRALVIAPEQFEESFPSAVGCLDTVRYVTGQGRAKKAAFDLH